MSSGFRCAIVFIATRSLAASVTDLDGPAVVQLRTDLHTILNSVNHDCDPTLRIFLSQPDADLISASHLAAEISQLFNSLERDIINRLVGYRTDGWSNPSVCLAHVSRALLENRDIASRLEYSGSLGVLLRPVWNEAFGDSFQYLSSPEYPAPSGWMDSLKSSMRLIGSRDKRLSPESARALLRSSTAGRSMWRNLKYHAVVYMTVHFLMLRDGDCANLNRLVPLLNSRDTDLETCIHYDSLVSFCPDAIDVRTQQNVLFKLMGNRGSRDARRIREILSLTDRDDLDPATYMHLWARAASWSFDPEFSGPLLEKVSETLTTLVHAISNNPQDAHPVNRLEILSTVVAPYRWFHIPSELEKPLLAIWHTYVNTMRPVRAHAVCYVNMYPLMFSYDPDMMAQFCAKAPSLAHLFSVSQDPTISEFWSIAQILIRRKWCPTIAV